MCFYFNSGPSCHKLNESHRIANQSFGDFNATVHFLAEIGAWARLRGVSRHTELPLFYVTCNATNARGSISSNRIFVNDFRKHFSRDPVVYREQVDLNTDSDASTTLKCLTSSPRIEEKLNTAPLTWNLPSVRLPFRWFYCGSGNLNQCLATKVPLPTSWLENAQVRDTGALFFNYRKSAVKPVAFLCMLFNAPVAINAGTVKKQRRPSTTRRPRMLPPVGDQKVVLLNQTGYSLALFCGFDYQRAQIVSCVWRFNDTVLRRSSGETDGLSVKSTRITFTAPFSAARIGSYSCSVTYVFGSSGTSEMTRRYDVKIVNIPTADVSNPTEVIVVTGSTAHVACRFHPSAAVTPSISVCGRDMAVHDKFLFERQMAAINQDFRHVKVKMNASINGYPVAKGATLIFEDRTPALQIPSVYNIACVGTAEFFRIRKRALVRVIPKPVIVSNMRWKKKVFCKNFCRFTCEVKNSKFYRKLRISVEVHWALETWDSRYKAFLPKRNFTKGLSYVNLHVSRRRFLHKIKCRVWLRSVRNEKVLYKSDNDLAFRKVTAITVETLPHFSVMVTEALICIMIAMILLIVFISIYMYRLEDKSID